MKQHFIILSLLILFFSCAKEPAPEKPPPQPPPPPCVPPILYADTTLLEFFPDSTFSKFVFKNKYNVFWIFDNIKFSRHISVAQNNPCGPSRENISVGCNGINYASRIGYYTGGGFKNKIIISIGRVDFDYMVCYAASFVLKTDSLGERLDSIKLQEKTFYDVYHYIGWGYDCCPQMYYNKQYGVVAFQWLSDLYVLETDSL